MKTVACIIARTNSSRLPKKVLKEINGKMMIEHIIDRIKKCKLINEIYVCTSTHPDDSILKKVSKKNKVKFYAGSEESVTNRMLDVAEIENCDNVIRITGDNIFTDSVYIDLMIEKHNEGCFEYTRTAFLPVGVTAEIISVDALKKCNKIMNPDESQYLMLYMFQPKIFKCQVLIPPKNHRRPNWCLTVDNHDDWERTQKIFNYFNYENKLFTYNMILEVAETTLLQNLKFNSVSTVKFPANLSIYFDSFQKEMNSRIKNSYKTHVTIKQYRRVMNEQGF